MRRNGKNSRNHKHHKGVIRIFKWSFKLVKLLILPLLLLLVFCWLFSFFNIGFSWLNIPFLGNSSTNHTELNLNTSESDSNTNSPTISTPTVTINDNHEQSFSTNNVSGTTNPTITLKPTTTVTIVVPLTVVPTITPTSTPVPTLTPTSTPISTPVPTLTPTSTPTSTPVPTLTPTSTPTSTPVPNLTLTSTPTSTPVPTLTPTSTPISTPVPTTTVTITPTNTLEVSETSYFNTDTATKSTSNSNSTITPTSTASELGNTQLSGYTIPPSPQVSLVTLPTTNPVDNYSAVTEITLDIPLLTQVISASDEEIVLYDLITLSFEKDTLNIECELYLVEFFASIDTLEYMKDSNIKYINVQGFKTLNISSIFSCAKDYDVSEIHVLWKKDNPNENYKMGIVMEQSILAIIFKGICNYDLTN